MLLHIRKFLLLPLRTSPPPSPLLLKFQPQGSKFSFESKILEWWLKSQRGGSNLGVELEAQLYI